MHHQTTLSGEAARLERHRRGQLVEDVIADIFGTYKQGHTASNPLEQSDCLIPGVPGHMVGAGRGLDRDFLPLSLGRPFSAPPAFMTEGGPVLAPDLRIDRPDGRAKLIEIKSRDFPLRREGRLFVGYHDHQIASYQRLARLGLPLSLMVVCHAQFAIQLTVPDQTPAFKLWGVWRFSPEQIVQLDLIEGIAREGSTDQFFELTEANRIAQEDEARILHTLCYRAQRAGINLLDRVEGTTRAGR